jgi:hypothetical protein
MKSITLTLALTLFQFVSQAQNFALPSDYKLETPADYDKYEDKFIECINWLEITPINEEKKLRNQANLFLMTWLTGSPKVKVLIKSEIVTFMDNPDLLLIFLGSWARYSIESDDFENPIKGSTAGIHSVIEFYKKNKKVMPKNKAIEKYIKMQNKGTLEDHISKNA